MKYLFEINIYTDGDFSLPFVPHEMKYDGSYEYSFSKTYANKSAAIYDAIGICDFLKRNIHTNRESMRELWVEKIDDFQSLLTDNQDDDSFDIKIAISGNYEGTEFVFKSVGDTVVCRFDVTEDELAIIKKDSSVTKDMIKKAVLALYGINKTIDKTELTDIVNRKEA